MKQARESFEKWADRDAGYPFPLEAEYRIIARQAWQAATQETGRECAEIAEHRFESGNYEHDLKYAGRRGIAAKIREKYGLD